VIVFIIASAVAVLCDHSLILLTLIFGPLSLLLPEILPAERMTDSEREGPEPTGIPLGDGTVLVPTQDESLSACATSAQIADPQAGTFRVSLRIFRGLGGSGMRKATLGLCAVVLALRLVAFIAGSADASYGYVLMPVAASVAALTWALMLGLVFACVGTIWELATYANRVAVTVDERAVRLNDDAIPFERVTSVRGDGGTLRLSYLTGEGFPNSLRLAAPPVAGPFGSDKLVWTIATIIAARTDMALGAVR
jgi:hypothetical protein